MSRLTRFTRDSLTEQQRALFDEIAEGEHATQRPRFRRVGPDNALEGPFNARLLSPAVGHALYQLATALRYQTELSARTRELVILTVAGACECDYQLRAHTDIGRAVGLSEREVELATTGGELLLNGEEQAAVDVTRHLLDTGDLDDDAYATAVEQLGERRLFEVLALTSSYIQTAMAIRVFRVTPPESWVRLR